MKFVVNIKASPAEARAFLGLPDLTPLHEAWIEHMKAFSLGTATADEWQHLMKSWSGGVPGVSEGLEAWQKLMQSAVQPITTKPEKKR